MPELHLGKYHRYLWPNRGLLVVLGEFPEILVSKQLYEQRHHIPPVTGPSGKTLERVLATAALAAVSLADRESWGWTLTMPDSPLGCFCGVEPEGMICGRTRPADPNRTAVYVQRQKGQAPLTQSHYQIETDDVVEAMETYFDRAQQTWTRIALDHTGSGALIQAMPDADIGELDLIDRSELLDRCRSIEAAGQLESLDEVVLFYECRCDDKMILDMLTSLPAPQREELWGGESSLEIECPRCGRQYVIRRNAV